MVMSNYYKKQKKKMQNNLIKVASFCINAIDVVDTYNYQESLYLLTKMIEKMRKDSTHVR
jgi:hypothetical protein